MALREPLDPVEARIVGVLVEKELTTPDGYPLSINALQSGCNQKSNRAPVTSYTEQTLREALTRLRLHRLVNEVHSAGARVEKYGHAVRDVLGVDGPELAVVAELLLRGAQTHGELRQRASRMTRIESLSKLDRVLDGLRSRGFVRDLPPAPGSRARRVTHALGEPRDGDAEAAAPASDTSAGPPVRPTTPVDGDATPPGAATATPAPDRPSAAAGDLEARVAALEAEVARLARLLDA